jgi:hypothetical protein
MRFFGRWVKWSIISFIVCYILLQVFLGLGLDWLIWGAENDPIPSCFWAGLFFGFLAAIKED